LAADPSTRKRDVAIWYLFVAGIGLLLAQLAWSSYSQIETIPFSQFDQLVVENKVHDVTIGADLVQGTLKEPARRQDAIRFGPR
jgi:cell division protease FtsH